MKKIMTCLLISLFVLSGCSKDDSAKLKEDVKVIEKDVADDVAKMENITKERIDEAAVYIKENIDKAEDGEVAKKLIEYGAYLEAAAKQGETEVTHDLATLGSKAKEYATKLYTSAEKEKDTILEEGKKDMDWISSKLNEGKDTLVEEFHNLIHR